MYVLCCFLSHMTLQESHHLLQKILWPCLIPLIQRKISQYKAITKNNLCNQSILLIIMALTAAELKHMVVVVAATRHFMKCRRGETVHIHDVRHNFIAAPSHQDADSDEFDLLGFLDKLITEM